MLLAEVSAPDIRRRLFEVVMATLSVAVVGAGPAGATTARLLAGLGARVSIFEARRLPRPKTCGGGLTPKAQRLVPLSALETIERRVHKVEIRGGLLPALRLDEPDAEIAMIERSRFDLALTEAAAAAGAEVRDGERVEGVVEDSSGVTLTTQMGRLRVDAVVAADGDPGGTARRLGLGGPPARHALALEVDMPFSSQVPTDTAILSFGIPGGYAWYFPKGDHANVGVGTYHPAAGVALRQDLARFAKSVDLDPADGRIAGHWIPQGLRRGPLASPRVVLAGDAAATADPLLGEGIAYALISGIAAAQVIGDFDAGRLPDLCPYDGRLRELLGPALRCLEHAALAVEPSITLAMTALRLSRWLRETAVDAIAGRRRPFAIDAHCELACACGIDRDALAFDGCTEPCARRVPVRLDQSACHATVEVQGPCRRASSGSQQPALLW